MGQIVGRYPFFIWLLPVFFVFHGFKENYRLIPPYSAVILTAYYFFISSIILLISRFLLGTYYRASLFSFAAMALYFFFGPIHDILKYYSNNSFISRYSFILPLITILLVLVFLLVKRIRKTNSRLYYYLNCLFFILILSDIFLFAFIDKKKDEVSSVYNAPLTPCPNCKKPDLYIIIADEYTSGRALSQLFSHDNKPFFNELENRGFKVLTKSRSNYNATAYTMASYFNLNYIMGLKDTTDSKENIGLCYSLIRKNQFVEYFKKNGYRFFNYSAFDFDNEPAFTTHGFLPDKTTPITGQTLSGRILRDLWFHLVTDLNWKSAINAVTYVHLDRNNKTYDQAMDVIKNYKEGPKLVYTHLIMPHNPYYYTASGRLRTPDELTEYLRADKKAYSEYIFYVNNKLLQLIDHIIKNSTSEPVIFLAGDHGFRHYDQSVSPDFQFENLSAISLPVRDYTQLHDSMTLINQIRTVLNVQFNQNLPLLQDSLIFIRQ
jgi:hypothetical protein